jgi:thiol-disulfide isomerase/thioredoxin
MPATQLIGRDVPTLAEGVWFNSGGATSTDAYRGKVVVLQFGFTACASCAKFEPRIMGVLDKYADQDVVMICVMDGRMDDEEAVRRYIEDHHVQGPVVLDREGKLFDRLEITSSPSVFVVSGAGKILWWQATVREALVDEWILEALAQNRKMPARAAALDRRNDRT